MGTATNGLPLGCELGNNGNIVHGATSEQDANQALMELDKTLRASKVGDQCEGIVRYSRLFEKFPFPILINAAFLRLADLFISGNNFLRLCILKVVQQSKRDLDKIINVDEFVRRIFQVIHSNDPIARAVTLRLLGEMARIMPERTSVHHAIRCALDSNDKVEMEAAIVAAFCFAKESKTFASSIFSKLTSMIDGLATPSQMKLKLIRLFQAMHHDNDLSTAVRSFLTGSNSSSTSFLAANPSQPFVVVVLDTLTKLATHSVVDIPDQVCLLIHHLRSDPRVAVKRCALRGLKSLADENPHRWDEASCEELLTFVTKLVDEECASKGQDSRPDPTPRLLTSTLDILTSLSKTVVNPGSLRAFDPEFPHFWSIFINLCHHDDLRVAAAACQLRSDVALHRCAALKKGDGQWDSVTREAAAALEAFLVISVQSARDDEAAFSMAAAKRGMKCSVQLSRTSPTIAVTFVATISASLKIANCEMTTMLLETLAAIGSYNVEALTVCADDVRDMLKDLLNDRKASSDRQIELLCTLLFQLGEKSGNAASFGLLLDSTPFVETRSWCAYRIARQAARYGHFSVAVAILKRLSSRGVASTFLTAWLKGFHLICCVEDTLASDVSAMQLNDSVDSTSPSSPTPLARLLKATESAHLGITQLSVAVSPTYPLTFPLQLARLRAASLHSCIQLLRASNCLRTCPPPAIAASTGTGDITKGSRVNVQLHAVSKEFRLLADQINGLLQASFDADASSLKYLNLLRLSASILISAIDSLIIHAPVGGQKGRNTASTVLNSLIGGADSSSLLNDNSTPLDLRRLVDNCKTALKKLAAIENSSRPLPPLEVRVQLIQELCLLLIAQPVALPRYFFQSLQVTNIKLAISPQPKVIGEPVTVMPDTQMVLKVEGVIQHGTSSLQEGGASISDAPTSAAPPPKKRRTDKDVNLGGASDDSWARESRRHRDIRKVVVTVKTSLQSKAASTPPEMNLKPETTSQSLSRSVIPLNDYFCQQFLLPFPVAGIHQVGIQVSVQDEVGSEWMTGPKTSLVVKVLDAGDQGTGRRHQEPLIGAGNVTF